MVNLSNLKGVVFGNIEEVFFESSLGELVEEKIMGIACASALISHRVDFSVMRMRDGVEKVVVAFYEQDRNTYLFELSFVYSTKNRVVFEAYLHIDDMAFINKQIRRFIKSENLIRHGGEMIRISNHKDMEQIIDVVKALVDM
jgi:hypothetical protein